MPNKIEINLKRVTAYQLAQCKLFAEHSEPSSIDKYTDRGQGVSAIIQRQIYAGKVAEFVVYHYLNDKGKSPSLPDLAIYDKDNKTYYADIFSGTANIHVKCHVANDKYPVSWLFQKSDQLTTKPSENDFLALVVVSKQGNYMYLIPAASVEYGEPKKDQLKENKVAIYESDLK